jgi:hypothetical protein
MTEEQDKLADVFNAFAAKAQQDHPQLKDGLIILDNASGKTFGSFTRASSVIAGGKLAEWLANVSTEVTAKGSQAFLMMGKINGNSVPIGNIIGYQEKDWLSGQFAGTVSKIDDRTFTLYHELGHLVVANGFNNFEDKGMKNRAETGADIYALIRLSQLYPDEAGEFFQKLRLLRSLSMAENGDVEHFSGPAIETLRQIRKETDLSQFSPAEAAWLAAAIAKAHQFPAAAIESAEKIFKDFRNSVIESKDLQASLRGLARDILAADDTVFKMTFQYLQPFLDGEISRGSFDFTGEYWDDMRPKLKERETPPPVPQLAVTRKSL